MGWRGGSVFKSTVQGKQFSCQNPQGSSQLSVNPVLENPVPTSGRYGHQAGVWYTDIHTHK